MNFNDRIEIENSGFKGFKTVKELWKDRKVIPKKMGVYLVIDPNFETTEFINPGVGGFFKDKDPNVDISELKNNYLPKAKIVYIGKAGGSGVKATLHSRLGQYLNFGKTKKVGHAGGRYIWQIKKHSELIFCWKEISEKEPVEVERELINDFIKEFKRMPYANLV